MERILISVAAAIASASLTGCIATAPVSIAWRSNASQQYATTEGRTDIQEGSPAVNADKTTEAATSVNTSSGAATASQGEMHD